jgi:hypothetical protein
MKGIDSICMRFLFWLSSAGMNITFVSLSISLNLTSSLATTPLSHFYNFYDDPMRYYFEKKFERSLQPFEFIQFLFSWNDLCKLDADKQILLYFLTPFLQLFNTQAHVAVEKLIWLDFTCQNSFIQTFFILIFCARLTNVHCQGNKSKKKI